ncbi:sensor domain-containing diguanylate cyclase [Ancylobacter radicis]|uniref:Sensor domain-containing diguanylate cyclase n=1 Tax=Ancylobacter radicis TaxID=2836179 RepID=A0ABS5R7N5_9HYPH|nr:sensor domain-containing diguanylate cyclase [Ancylobacter radicis]MBS9477502.1 sensor domain-containing diguanylate cyclase [Ancylobacter radicis]
MKEILDRAGQDMVCANGDLHLILDAIPTPLSWATLPDGRIRFINRAFKKTFGYEDGTFATVEDWIDHGYAHEDDRCRARLRWRELWNSVGRGTTEIEPIELPVLCADGTVLTVQHRGIVLHEAGVAIATFEDISALKLAKDALRRIAFEDSLTGLPNRRALQTRWSEAIARKPAALALLIIDLDHFKPVNDAYGHETGDMALSLVGRRLEACAAPEFLCRLGGDEFAILIESDSAHAQAERICAAIAAAFAGPFMIGGTEAAIGASVGVSLYPEHGTGLGELLRHADEALYRLKRAGRSGHEWYAAPARA